MSTLPIWWVWRLRQQLHPSTYAVGHDGLSADGRVMAAVLAGGDGAAASHRTAGALLQVVPFDEDLPVDVCVRGGAGRENDRLAAHRSAVRIEDVTRRETLLAAELGAALAR